MIKDMLIDALRDGLIDDDEAQRLVDECFDLVIEYVEGLESDVSDLKVIRQLLESDNKMLLDKLSEVKL